MHIRQIQVINDRVSKFVRHGWRISEIKVYLMVIMLTVQLAMYGSKITQNNSLKGQHCSHLEHECCYKWRIRDFLKEEGRAKDRNSHEIENNLVSRGWGSSICCFMAFNIAGDPEFPVKNPTTSGGVNLLFSENEKCCVP